MGLYNPEPTQEETAFIEAFIKLVESAPSSIHFSVRDGHEPGMGTISLMHKTSYGFGGLHKAIPVKVA